MAIVGIIGAGVVGGTLAKWFSENTSHDVRLYDPPKEKKDFLEDCEAIFISVPVPVGPKGQDLTLLKESVTLAKKYTDNVFIRSTVLPGTNDLLGTISMPEFLTERRAYSDMTKYPIACGTADMTLLERIFPNKQIKMVSNVEAEWGKLSHNLYGAFKVLFWNMIYKLSEQDAADYENILKIAMITGFIEPQHTKIAQDGKFGFGGRCFPENLDATINMLIAQGALEASLFEEVKELNEAYRNPEEEEDFTTTSLPLQFVVDENSGYANNEFVSAGDSLDLS